ncbi:hypothetical protein GCM10009623_13500 [Nocardioides aestuarii]|uniref:VanZ-like domain-containing protein n=1 Tax=Nocardioides aestuarii TaxID=252231 RepID=A0ABW4TJA0_9ACTN
MAEAAVLRETPSAARVANIAAKSALVLLLVLALLLPDAAHLRGKGAGARAVVYPLLAFGIPLVWWVWWRDRVSFPWLPDLMVTLTCFSDILGNRMDLYDTIVWFDDWMHFMNTGLLAAAFVLLTLPRTAPMSRVLERSLALGATGAIVWEVGEYFAFLAESSERRFAYGDTLGDLGLGVLGSVVAAVVVRALWGGGLLAQVEPLPARR